MIVTKNLSKSFGSFQALRNISFEINKGEIVGFLGQNGAGKTTLMRILTTYLSATSGQAFIDGIDLAKDPLNIRRKIGYLPENPPLYPSMSVRDYLRFAANLKDVPKKILNSAIDLALNECNLCDVSDKLIATLSKGYKQRVGIAQAIVHNPDVLILDEPTTGLDPVQIIAIRALIKSFEGRKTVILSTHILSEIEKLAQRVMIIKEGRIILDDSIKNLASRDSLESVFLQTVGLEDNVL